MALAFALILCTGTGCATYLVMQGQGSAGCLVAVMAVAGTKILKES